MWKSLIKINRFGDRFVLAMFNKRLMTPIIISVLELIKWSSNFQMVIWVNSNSKSHVEFMKFESPKNGDSELDSNSDSDSIPNGINGIGIANNLVLQNCKSELELG